MELKRDERIDDLEYKELRIIQNKKQFCFGIDSILLCDFAKKIKKDAKVIDLGTGTGIIPILLTAKTKLKKIIGVEIQENMSEMATRSVILNKMQEKIEIINGDIKNTENIFKKDSFDVVITNPPYKKVNTGIQNQEEGKLISRHEIKCNLEDIIKSTKYLLKNNGEFYMIHRPERLADILLMMKKYTIEPKIIKSVYPKKNKEPKLILIKGVKNGRAFLKVEKPIYIYDENGDYTEDILKMYNKLDGG